LRFNCHSNKSIQACSGQRIIETESIPQNLLIEKAEKYGDQLRITWCASSGQDESFIPIEFLKHNSPDFDKNEYSSPKFKTANSLEHFDYMNLVDSHGNENKEYIYKYEIQFQNLNFRFNRMLNFILCDRWLKHMAEYGVCIVKKLPTQENMVRKLAEIIAPIQRTIYDEIFDVKAEPSPINIAYSATKLCFHMDLIYYESAPGLQFLHCLKYL
jgi:hypothetical protein